MDERNKLIAYKVIAIMYFLTILAIHGDVLYRQFVMGQELEQFEDIAIIMTFNSLFLISALLYFGAIPIRKIKIKTILWGYIIFVVMGFLFTYFKYNIAQSPGLSIDALLHKFGIVAAVTGIISLFFVVFSFLGKRREEKELE